MGFLGSFKDRPGKRDDASEIVEEMSLHIRQVQSVLLEFQGAMTGLPAPIREAAQRAYVDNVGENIDDSLRRLTNLQKKIISGKLNDVSEREIIALRAVMMKLYDHLKGSYREVKHLPEERKDRRLVKETAKERSAKVKELMRTLDRFTR